MSRAFRFQYANFCLDSFLFTTPARRRALRGGATVECDANAAAVVGDFGLEVVPPPCGESLLQVFGGHWFFL